MSSIADCNKCLRRHIRSVGSRCKYNKAAIDKCRQLGHDETEYLLHLPEIDSDYVDVGANGSSMPGRALAGDRDGMVKDLLVENATYTKELLAQRTLVEELTKKIASLETTANVSAARAGIFANGGLLHAPAVRMSTATTTTTTTTRVYGSYVTSSQNIPSHLLATGSSQCTHISVLPQQLTVTSVCSRFWTWCITWCLSYHV